MSTGGVYPAHWPYSCSIFNTDNKGPSLLSKALKKKRIKSYDEAQCTSLTVSHGLKSRPKVRLPVQAVCRRVLPSVEKVSATRVALELGTRVQWADGSRRALTAREIKLFPPTEVHG